MLRNDFYDFFLICTLLFYRYVTALHIAADKAHYDVMDVLLKHGAKVGTYFTSQLKRCIVVVQSKSYLISIISL